MLEELFEARHEEDAQNERWGGTRGIGRMPLIKESGFKMYEQELKDSAVESVMEKLTVAEKPRDRSLKEMGSEAPTRTKPAMKQIGRPKGKRLVSMRKKKWKNPNAMEDIGSVLRGRNPTIRKRDYDP